MQDLRHKDTIPLVPAKRVVPACLLFAEQGWDPYSKFLVHNRPDADILLSEAHFLAAISFKIKGNSKKVTSIKIPTIVLSIRKPFLFLT